MALVAQLGNHVFLLGRFDQLTAFIHGMGQGFFAVNMFTPFDGGHGGHGVDMVRGGHHHRIDLPLHFVQHFAEVPVLLGLGKLPEGAAGPPRIHIAEGHDVGSQTGHGIDVAMAHAAHADAGHVDLFGGRSLAASGHRMTGNYRTQPCRCPCGGQKTPSCPPTSATHNRFLLQKRNLVKRNVYSRSHPPASRLPSSTVSPG